MNLDLRGKVALVTGAGNGIGREILTTLAREGVTAVALDARQSALEEVAGDFTANGWAGMTAQCDVRDFTGIQKLVADVISRFGRIDILVNNAGVAGRRASRGVIRRDMGSQPGHQSQGNFPDVQGGDSGDESAARAGALSMPPRSPPSSPSLNSAAYASSKAGVHYFTRVLAGELGPWGYYRKLLRAGDDSHADEPFCGSAARTTGAASGYP